VAGFYTAVDSYETVGNKNNYIEERTFGMDAIDEAEALYLEFLTAVIGD